MTSTHLCLQYHVIFSTKNREPLILPSFRDRLHAFLGGTIRQLDGLPHAVGGTIDHVHMLMGLRSTHCLAQVVKDIKRASSRWVHETIRMGGFAWQVGYGAFTVGWLEMERLRGYVMDQEEHHKVRTFQEEYRELLRQSGIEFDERYLW